MKRLLVANRTLEHAQALATATAASRLPLSELDRHLAEADIVITATASREPVLGASQVAAALKARRHRPMFLLDLAVPRDIAADVARARRRLPVHRRRPRAGDRGQPRSRREAAQQAEAIIDLQVEHYLAWWQAQGRQDALRQLAQPTARRRATQALAQAREQLGAGRGPGAKCCNAWRTS